MGALLWGCRKGYISSSVFPLYAHVLLGCDTAWMCVFLVPKRMHSRTYSEHSFIILFNMPSIFFLRAFVELVKRFVIRSVVVAFCALLRSS